MKKYKVLKKCKPFLVKGTVLEQTLKRKFTGEGINYLLNNKTIEEIEEIQEPEYTKDQLKECAEYVTGNISCKHYDYSRNVSDAVNKWIKGKE